MGVVRDRSGVVWGPFGLRSEIVRESFGVVRDRLGVVWESFGVRSEAVLESFGIVRGSSGARSFGSRLARFGDRLKILRKLFEKVFENVLDFFFEKA